MHDESIIIMYMENVCTWKLNILTIVKSGARKSFRVVHRVHDLIR